MKKILKTYDPLVIHDLRIHKGRESLFENYWKILEEKIEEFQATAIDDRRHGLTCFFCIISKPSLLDFFLFFLFFLFFYFSCFCFHFVKTRMNKILGLAFSEVFLPHSINLFVYPCFKITCFNFLTKYIDTWCKNAASVKPMTMITTVQLIVATYENFLFSFRIIPQ